MWFNELKNWLKHIWFPGRCDLIVSSISGSDIVQHKNELGWGVLTDMKYLYSEERTIYPCELNKVFNFKFQESY